jgi:dipeptidyl aminopeptidase/acylaminoacyl peptidase
LKLSCLAAALTAFALVAFPAHAAPLEAYGRLPAIEDAAISPDGSKLSLIVSDGRARKVAVRDLASGSTHVLDGQGEKLRGLTWADNNHLLISASGAARDNNLVFQTGELTRLFDYSVSTQKMRQLLRETPYDILFHAPAIRTVDGQTTLYFGEWMPGNNGPRAELWRLKLDQGFATPFKEGFPGTFDWAVGADGTPLAEYEYDLTSTRWTLKVMHDGAWAKSKQQSAPIDWPVFAGLGRDGLSALMWEDADGVSTYSEVSAATGEWRVASQTEGRTTPVREPRTDVLLGFRTRSGDDLKYELFAPRDQAIWNAVAAAYPGDEVSPVSWSKDHRKVIALVESAKTGPAYALVDFDAKSATWLGDLYPDLKAADIAERRPIRFAARDGLPLTGYVTLPQRRDGRPLPVVVLAHDGPDRRDEPGFDWLAEAIASRGYAVLQVNYRGSTGLGSDLYKAGLGHWDLTTTDLLDGLTYLSAQGIVDMTRSCIAGRGVGGYAALASVTLAKGPYRCAAAVNGLTDPAAYLAWVSSRRSVSEFKWWIRSMGVTSASDPGLAALSPLAHAAAASAPILLIHGTADTVVPQAQAPALQKALVALGKPVDLVTLEGEDHWLSRGETRQQMLTSLVAFLEKNNPPN